MMGVVRGMVGAGLALAAMLAGPAEVAAQEVRWGFRGGVSLNPDGFSIGGHGEFRPTDLPELAVVPSADVTVGSEHSIDYTGLRLTGNAHWYFAPQEGFTPFALGGVSFYMFDDELSPSESGLGLNLGGGADFGALSTELWLGVGENPDLALWLAYTFP